jgi:uncharacterized protein YndB with AHSA1/START domain
MTRDFTLTWMLDARPAEVFRAWTDPGHLHWFYNDDNPVPPEPIEVDLRVGGAWRQLMVINESTAYVTGGVYREIVPDEKLVFAWGATGGWPELDPERLDDNPLVTVRLAEVGERTEMNVRVELPESLSEERRRLARHRRPPRRRARKHRDDRVTLRGRPLSHGRRGHRRRGDEQTVWPLVARRRGDQRDEQSGEQGGDSCRRRSSACC